jgi:glucan phosphoethanolaminetransferase (alkaline phosphatase superfamily)
MGEPFDKDIELVKLQIVAETSLADMQINMSLVSSSIIILFVFLLTVVIQYPASFPPAAAVASIAFGLAILFVIFMFDARRKYERGSRELNGYVENFKAGKPLPPLTTLCGVKEKEEKTKSRKKRDS